MSAFLRGLWEVDGGICIKSSDGSFKAYFCGNKEAMVQVSIILTSFEIKNNYLVHKAGSKFISPSNGKVYISNHIYCTSFASKKAIYDNTVSIQLTRKREIIDKFLVYYKTYPFGETDTPFYGISDEDVENDNFDKSKFTKTQ